MSNRKLLSKILRLKGMKITHYLFKNRDKELHLTVKPDKNGCRCPECGRRGRIVRHTIALRRWEALTLMGMKVLLWYAPKESHCPTHGRMQETIPWAPTDSRITYRLEGRIGARCQGMTRKAAAEILKMPPSTLSDLPRRIITRVRDGHAIRGVTPLGGDEISFLKGRKFATPVYDLDRSRVLWAGQGKGRETIDRFFNEALRKGRKARILWVGCNMSRTYAEAITHHCPNATPVIDRFPVVKALNQAVDEARKDEFEHIGNYRYRASAEKFLKRWMTAALRSRIPSLRQFVGTVRNHFDTIVAFTDRNLTNAVGEGLARIVQIGKNRASGYRNPDNFAEMNFLTVGDPDIPAHIPSHLRTL